MYHSRANSEKSNNAQWKRFESTRGYCCLKQALVFLGFKSTKNMNMLQIFDRKCFIDSLATIFSARCKPIYIDRSCTLH